MDKKIAKYLKDKKDQLLELYTWDFDPAIPQKKFGISIEGASWLEKTRSLRRKLREYIAANPDSQVEVAEYFIKDWGGMEQFSESRDVVNHFLKWRGTLTMPEGFKPKFTSISSWSKWAALVCPDWACVYDARVAYSINAINYLGDGDQKIYPMPAQKSSRTALLDIDVSTLLLQKMLKNPSNNNPKNIKAAYFVAEGDVYRQYLNLLVSVSEILWNDREHIHEVEMLLFTLADTEIYSDLFVKVGAEREMAGDYLLDTENIGYAADSDNGLEFNCFQE